MRKSIELIRAAMDPKLLDTNCVLLGWVQQYLRERLELVRPDDLVVAAWDEFYRTYDGLIRRFAIARGLRNADVDDCTQMVWMAVAAELQCFECVDKRSGFRSWLYMIVRSKASDLVRRRRSRPACSLDVMRESGNEPAGNDADSSQEQQEWELALLKELVDEVCSEQSEENARLLRMRCLEGREVANVAAELGLTSEQVWYRLHRLMKKLRARAAVFSGESFNSEPIEPADEGASVVS